MSRRRWWELGTHSVEAEQTEFAKSGLDFRIDQELFETHGAVVFRGELRLGRLRTSASVHYPPTYADGGHPTVAAPDLEIGRHQTPTGEFCLDHPSLGFTQPMTGAEAVERAERLWFLWEKDPSQLSQEEVDAPDPHSHYLQCVPGSAVVLGDVDLQGAAHGYFRIEASLLDPLRGPVTQVRAVDPIARELPLDTSPLRPLRGATEITGEWIRSAEPPPTTAADFAEWLITRYRPAVERQIKHADSTGIADAPAVIAVVFKDEGPAKGETHDAWAFFSIKTERRPTCGIARTFWLRDSERWVRQPQLRELANKTVCVVGVGAIGSPLVDLLARAGVGRLKLVDRDYFSVGNRVRHALDLSALGKDKVEAAAVRARLVNPWLEVQPLPFGLGNSGGARAEEAFQRIDAWLVEQILDGTDLLIDATAHNVTATYLSRIAAEARLPAIHAWVSAGAWGGRVLIQRPDQASGCWDCLGRTQLDGSVEVPEVPQDPDVTELTEQGCADPAFTGPGFDITAVASVATRAAVGLLLAHEGGYPTPGYDLATLSFRNEQRADFDIRQTQVPAHSQCTTCVAPPK